MRCQPMQSCTSFPDRENRGTIMRGQSTVGTLWPIGQRAVLFALVVIWFGTTVSRAGTISVIETGTITSASGSVPLPIGQPFTLTSTYDTTATSIITGGPDASTTFSSGSFTISIDSTQVGYAATNHIQWTPQPTAPQTSLLEGANGILLDYSASVTNPSTPIPNPLSVTSSFSTNVTPSLLIPGNILSLEASDIGSLANQGGVEQINGSITGLTINTAPSPSLYLTVALGSTISPSKQYTGISATLTLATTMPSQPNTIPLPITLPSDATTLQQAATDLHYQGFNWVQLENIPAPSPTDFSPNNNPFTPITGPTNDAPPSGWYYEAQNPQTAGANAYPYYYDPNASPSLIYSLSNPSYEPNPNTLNFFDKPADQCLPPVNVDGVPTGGYSGPSILSPFLSATCGFQNAASPNASLAYHTELVGMISVGSPCPANGGVCYEQDSSNNGAPTILPTGSLCPVGETCYETVGYFDWTDTFNGTAGGISSSTNYLGLIDPGSGAGGITITSLDGAPVFSAVPEPSSIGLLIFAILGVSGIRRMRCGRLGDLSEGVYVSGEPPSNTYDGITTS
jgi:hypothetical protein